MPLKIRAPDGPLLLEPEDLCQNSFSLFGTVVENPLPSLIPNAQLKNIPPNAAQANQGSALKYSDVTDMRNLYDFAPSNEPAKAVMNMFVCAPRSLLPSQDRGLEGSFPVQILERHPFTIQTFIPLGLSPLEANEARYLVVVAPTLPDSSEDEMLPVPHVGAAVFPGRGLPDLTKVRAFMARGSQAVTYGPGTWHAPMVVVGTRPVDFVVVQFANGVALEDCQEVAWEVEEHRRIMVGIPKAPGLRALLKL